MKKLLSVSLLLLVLSSFFFSHSMRNENGILYHDKKNTITNHSFDANFQINRFFELSAQGDVLLFNNFHMNFSGSMGYSIEKFNVQSNTILFGMNSSDFFVNHIEMAFTFFNSKAENGKLNFTFKNFSLSDINVLPDFSQMYSGKVKMFFSGDFSMTARAFLFYPKLYVSDENKEISGKGKMLSGNFSKKFFMNKCMLQPEIGLFIGNGAADGNFFINQFFEQQFIVDAEFDFSAYYASLNFHHDQNHFGMNAMTGLIFIPAVNYSYDMSMRTYYFGKWRRKTLNETSAVLKNAMFIPFTLVFSIKNILPKKNLTVDFSKKLLFPLNANKKNAPDGTSSPNNFSSINLKTILLSGLSVNFRIEF